ncbi:pentatricopeptide repeat-containing protein At2g45350, chloroplastic [Rhodamnia argentea]|uniref:Pentatricopeptide repeat-containing protein At2g45350, chloroplastic n=1 Tax=Rhodamnia argentea TaxID=178133 RepID=A0A8B8PKI9_9MYRT|nr:pentatricopeptide repeat-containing protein At2g45350, chloroplastic [Rhodamnia argentea]
MFLFSNPNQPWNSIQPTLAHLRNCKTPHDVNQIHARLITTGLIRSASLTSKLILVLCSSPDPPVAEFARRVFFAHRAFSRRGNGEDPFLWNAILKSYSHGEEPERALPVFRLMVENGILGDKFSFSLVFKACSRLGSLKEGLQVHGLLRKLEMASDLYLQNCLMGWYLRCGCLDDARHVFGRMAARDSVSYNCMIDGYVKCGMIDSARELFDSMPIEEKNLISWNSMLSGYSQLEDGLIPARKLFEEMPERDLISWNTMIHAYVRCGKMGDAHGLFNAMPEMDVVTWANMIDGYAKIGHVDIARDFFSEIPERDVVACNAMMAGYAENGLHAEALEIFYSMKRERNLSPDITTLLIVLSAIAQLGQLNEGIAVHRYITDIGFSLRGNLGVALIDMYSKCGSIQNAKSVFDVLPEKNVDHWNAIIGGLAIHGLGECAFGMLMEMERLSVKPDDITFIGVLHACGHSGLVKEGLICFELMRRVYKINPRIKHYGCMVDILCRAGYLNEAKKFIEEMPIERNDVIRRTLLSACKIQENYNIGLSVASSLFRQASCNSTSYILLSHMCAGLGLWKQARSVREVMKERRIPKLPGCSWIELNGIVHEFSVDDRSHSQVAEIYSILGSPLISNSEVTC